MGRIAVTAAAAVALPLAACSTSTPEPSRPPVARPAKPPQRAAPVLVNPAAYVPQASSIDLLIIRSSELALTRSSNGYIRDYASRMISAHKGLAAQMSLAGRRLNLLPSSTLLPRHQAMLDHLAMSADFDAAYKRLQLSVHTSSLNLHRAFSGRGTSPTLRPVAANAAAVEKPHLDRLRAL